VISSCVRGEVGDEPVDISSSCRFSSQMMKSLPDLLQMSRALFLLSVYLRPSLDPRQQMSGHSSCGKLFEISIEGIDFRPFILTKIFQTPNHNSLMIICESTFWGDECSLGSSMLFGDNSFIKKSLILYIKDQSL
jgi:hypothetical protein